mmetsp:Transcript_26433/g.39969  ORF Transcript_26433/g.39969 Transcript_26433/m.39969 type:complete len:227 (-) Transcript_26433:90-770(-)
MPPKRKASASTSAKGSKATKKKATPYDEFFEDYDKVMKRNPKNLGGMIIRGISKAEGEDSDEDDEDEEEEQDTSKYTAEQMASLRYVFITQKREDKLDEMRRFILGSQANDSIMMFNTSFSYEVMDGFEEYKSRIWKKMKTPAEKFDSLFAYTYNLKNYDTWIHDHEGGMGMDDMVKGLAGMWKRLLKNDDEKLGIDAEYTRPGVVQLLTDFQSDLDMQELEFDFQ